MLLHGILCECEWFLFFYFYSLPLKNIVMSTDVLNGVAIPLDANGNNLTLPKNALFTCHSPICLSQAPTLLPPDTAIPAKRLQIPLRVPDLRALGMIDARKTTVEYRVEEFSDTPTPPDEQQPSPQPLPPPQPPQQPPPTPPPTPQETRLGVVLRRVSPKRRDSIGVPKRINDPTAGVVLRRVDRNALLPPQLRRPRSPPPKRKPIVKPSVVATAPPPPPPPPPPPAPKTPEPPPKPVNLLLNRPPVEVLRIEGDKIIIIRRIPRQKPAVVLPPPKPSTSTNKDGHSFKSGHGHHKHHHHHSGDSSKDDKKHHHHRHHKEAVPKGPFKTIQKQVTAMQGVCFECVCMCVFVSVRVVYGSLVFVKGGLVFVRMCGRSSCLWLTTAIRGYH